VILLAVSSVALPRTLSTLETVIMDTPASVAMSFKVTFLPLCTINPPGEKSTDLLTALFRSCSAFLCI
jgi:hypothetical protein